ncbi:hypothetical protein BD779DRAFT_654957 [Infundibulicybe gibba]|nr:hypothetical protein BD779DRAFT_654957 [Infundibulicybe gibba]
MPTLWANIFVRLKRLSFSVHGYLIISTWLFLSFPCSISLMIRNPPFPPGMFANFIFQNLHRCRLLDLETTETELRPIGLWYGFQWSLSSLKSFLELDTLNLSLAKGLVDDDLREFLHPSSG